MNDQNILRRHLRPSAIKLGIDPKKANWRSLRASYATWIIEAGADPKSVQGPDAAFSHFDDDGYICPGRPGVPAEGRRQDGGYGRGALPRRANAKRSRAMKSNWYVLGRKTDQQPPSVIEKYSNSAGIWWS